MTPSSPWLVLGLGNPGPKYAGTRHNVGQMAVALMAEQSGGRLKSSRKTRCEVLETRIDEQRAVLAVPHSYMNESGGPASALVSYYSASTDRLIVLHDEIDLPFGSMRTKFGGGDNGHNGLRSIRTSLGTGDWFRIRLGVGRGRGEAADHVLAGFSGAERKQLPDALERAATCTTVLLSDGLAAAQNAFNS